MQFADKAVTMAKGLNRILKRGLSKNCISSTFAAIADRRSRCACVERCVRVVICITDRHQL